MKIIISCSLNECSIDYSEEIQHTCITSRLHTDIIYYCCYSVIDTSIITTIIIFVL